MSEEDRQILLAFYRIEEPESATDEKIGRVIRSFQRKAAQKGTPNSVSVGWIHASIGHGSG